MEEPGELWYWLTPDATRSPSIPVLILVSMDKESIAWTTELDI